MNIALTFLEPPAAHQKEKSYEIHFEVPGSFRSSNLDLKQHHGIHITDVRGREDQFTLEDHGFEYIEAPTSALTLPLKDQVSDMNDPALGRYLREVISLVKRRLGGHRVLLYDWRLRREGVSPITQGERPKDRLAPLAVAHVVRQYYSHKGGFPKS
ncbi:uncharacterized protein Z519_02219 [Cladophialophora bantiana CBS 173.52]|uniref:Uncharacterized protein n=1 Tax=Cladophialophora bantiana (strain ATCC 10958 / CBS 173.52 / CDC B-1940 / NIH 8579) TaxID=1442370 RepID=A0A0D2HTR4_CLAB1|nr:uncharacterized protein Z519_02219 [Cladophialophora bantiana CBS 173.52]KIW96828.1 hypothetical protein Z519_02219 [Cladophialophora bantiana CBS 173.52]